MFVLARFFSPTTLKWSLRSMSWEFNGHKHGRYNSCFWQQIRTAIKLRAYNSSGNQGDKWRCVCPHVCRFWKLNGKANEEFTKDPVSQKIVFRSICILPVLMRSLLGKRKSQATGVRVPFAKVICPSTIVTYWVWYLADHVHLSG